tara:strand:+ start:246 stop:563 length:318 start_codon:yes stop_codon:yes gene_type:complete
MAVPVLFSGGVCLADAASRSYDEKASGTVLIGHEKPGGVQSQYEMLADGIFASLLKRDLTVEEISDVLSALGATLVSYAEMQDSMLRAKLLADSHPKAQALSSDG